MSSARSDLRSAERALRVARGRYVTATTADILRARKALDAAEAHRARAADRYAAALAREALPTQGRAATRQGVQA